MSPVLQIVPNKLPKQLNADAGTVVAVRPSYVRILGDVSAAYVLSQLVYLYQRDTTGKAKHHLVRCTDGLHWVIRGYAQWGAELGLSLGQMRRAIEKLVEYGMVEQVIRLHERDKVSHIRLLCANGDASLNGYPEYGIDYQVMPSETDPPVVSSITQCHIQQGLVSNPTHPVVDSDKPLKSLEVLKKFKKNQAAATPTAASDLNTSPGEPGKMKANEMLQKFQSDKNVVTSPKNIGPLSLAGCWKRYLTGIGVEWVKDPTRVELGQLKHFIKSVGTDHAEPCLRWAVENWNSYVSQIRIDKGVDGLPQSPCIWVLAKYPDVLMQSIAQKAKEQQGWSKPAQTPLKVQEQQESATLAATPVKQTEPKSKKSSIAQLVAAKQQKV